MPASDEDILAAGRLMQECHPHVNEQMWDALTLDMVNWSHRTGLDIYDRHFLGDERHPEINEDARRLVSSAIDVLSEWVRGGCRELAGGQVPVSVGNDRGWPSKAWEVGSLMRKWIWINRTASRILSIRERDRIHKIIADKEEARIIAEGAKKAERRAMRNAIAARHVILSI